VADRLGRQATLIELNAEYAEIARNRLLRDAGMFASVQVEQRLQAAE
jgi:DNA modification methylase